MGIRLRVGEGILDLRTEKPWSLCLRVGDLRHQVCLVSTAQ